MTILFNSEPLELPNDFMTLTELAAFKQVPDQGTAIALNDKLIKRDLWPITKLQPFDRVTIITAAFGG